MSADVSEPAALSGRIEMRDAQGGFAGFTGTLTVIEPNGRYRVSRFVNENVSPPHVEGTLDAAELRRIRAALERTRLVTLPGELGERPPVNPHLVTIRLGAQETVMSLAPGQPIPEARAGFAARPDAPEARFLDLASEIVRMAQPSDGE